MVKGKDTLVDKDVASTAVVPHPQADQLVKQELPSDNLHLLHELNAGAIQLKVLCDDAIAFVPDKVGVVDELVATRVGDVDASVCIALQTCIVDDHFTSPLVHPNPSTKLVPGHLTGVDKHFAADVLDVDTIAHIVRHGGVNQAELVLCA